MSINDSAGELRLRLEDYAARHELELTENADRVIKGLLRFDGGCPCKLHRPKCPCPDHMQEITSAGQCHCGLFKSKE